MIYLDKMPRGDQITLIRPQPGGLEPKCRYRQATSFSGHVKGSHCFCSRIHWDRHTLCSISSRLRHTAGMPSSEKET